MNVRTLKLPTPRFDTPYWSTLHLQGWGQDNLYPQNLMRITGASGTAELCLARYVKFIEGYGWRDGALAGATLNHYGTTADELLHSVAEDVARFGGFALHVNYNILGAPTEVQYIPFEQCRLEEEDDAGNVAHIVLHPDWSGKKTHNGHRVLVNEANTRRLDVFNPKPSVVQAQIAKAGGIDHYDGQVMWCSLAGRNEYPVPIYDAVVTEISTDEGLGNVKNRNVRNNFLVGAMLITKKGVPRIDDDGNEVEQPMISDEDLKKFQGDTNSSKLMVVELESDEDKPEVVQFPAANFDKDFSVTDASVIERIYAQFHQELFYSIRIGKLGFSGQVMGDAFSYYAGEVTNEQRFISRNVGRVLGVMPQFANTDMAIEPLKYISNEGEQSNAE